MRMSRPQSSQPRARLVRNHEDAGIGLAVAPDYRALQQWASTPHISFASDVSRWAPPSRSAEMPNKVHRSITLAHPLYSAADALIKPSRIRYGRPTEERVYKHLQGAGAIRTRTELYRSSLDRSRFSRVS